MEALIACSTAALALYDMVKALERGVVITDLRLEAKSGGRSGAYREATGAMIRTGLDRLLAEPARLAGRRYGLLAHGASITGDARPIHRALAAARRAAEALFGPEHGFYGIEQDMVAAESQTDPWTGAPIVSLYGDSEKTLRPCPMRLQRARPAA